MPIYEYRCNHCGNEFEELLLGRDPEPEKCPKCQSDEIKRKISNTSFTLTGNGWYVTDYGGYNPGAVPSEGSSDGGSSDKGSTEGSQSAEKAPSGESSTSKTDSTGGKGTSSQESAKPSSNES